MRRMRPGGHAHAVHVAHARKLSMPGTCTERRRHSQAKDLAAFTDDQGVRFYILLLQDVRFPGSCTDGVLCDGVGVRARSTHDPTDCANNAVGCVTATTIQLYARPGVFNAKAATLPSGGGVGHELA